MGVLGQAKKFLTHIFNNSYDHILYQCTEVKDSVKTQTLTHPSEQNL